MNVDSRDSIPKSCDVIKEYHFYINDDREHAILFVQHCFGLIYESFKKKKHIIHKALDLVRWACKTVQLKTLFLLVGSTS